MRKKAALFVVWSLVAAGFVVMSPSPAPGLVNGTELSVAEYSGHANGVFLHVDALNADVEEGPRLVDAEAAFSGAAVDGQGFDDAVLNENLLPVVPPPSEPTTSVDPTGKETFGKGTGLEVGLGTSPPIINQIVPSRAEAAAHPAERSDGEPVESATHTGRVITQLVEIPASPLLYANLLESEAEAAFDPISCISGEDELLAFGRGQVAKAQLLDVGADDPVPTDDLDSPLVEVGSDFPEESTAADSQSFAYFVENEGEPGTVGLATETHVRFAPITLLRTDPTLPGEVRIEVLGIWVLRAVATGTTGYVEFEILGEDGEPLEGDDPILQINGTTVLTFAQLGLADFELAIPGLATINLDEDVRDIGDPPDAGSTPTETPTLASGALDVLRIDLAEGALGDIRLGHLEARAAVPEGGINCPGSVQVNKDAPDDAQDVAFDFTLECEYEDGDEDVDLVRTATITGDGETRFDNIPNGAICTVTEADEEGFVSQPPQEVTPDDPETDERETIERDTLHEVTFVNTRPPGSLEIVKDAPGDAQGVAFDFTVDCGDEGTEPDEGRTRTLTGDDSAVIDGIPSGEECTVREATATGFASQPDQTVTIVADETVTVTFVNTRVNPDEEGSLVVVKDAPDDAQQIAFDFTVDCGTEGTFVRTATGDGPAEPVTGIADGTQCIVSEETEDGFVERPDQTATIEAGETATVTFVNQRTGGPEPEPEPEPQPDGGGDGTQVRGVQITRQPAAAATAVSAQPRFTG